MEDSTPASKPKKQKKRRFRSPHPGVKLKPPQPGSRMPYWRMRFENPDTGKFVYERLDPVVHNLDSTARRDSAIRKSNAIAKRKLELDSGAPKATGASFAEGIEFYYANAAHLGSKTLADYRTSTKMLLQWADKENQSLDSLTRSKLVEFRAWAFKLKRQHTGKVGGGVREESHVTTQRRNAVTVNGDLRVARTVLGWLLQTDRLPKISKLEDIKVALKKYQEDKTIPEFLSPEELRELFEACERYDAVVFKLNREERERLGYKGVGSTPRYKPISAFVMTVLLTGMRLVEVCILDWRIHMTHLDSRGRDGKPVGEIRLRAPDTKTKCARVVSFDVSPSLRELFLAMRRVNGSKGLVFDLTYDEAQDAMVRLRDDYNAPARFTYQVLRSTCSTFLNNAPSIYGAAAAFHSAKRLGHSVAVSEKNYAGLMQGISPDARTLEVAMEIEDCFQAVINRILKPLELSSNVVNLRGQARD
jgi:integrase